MVTLADGTLKQIGDIQAGVDRVRCGTDISMTQSCDVALVDISISGGRQLLGINQQSAWFTAEHPLMLSNGVWASMRPDWTVNEEPSYINVVQMTAGQSIKHVSRGDELIESFTSTIIDNDTPVYNLILSSEHTYYVNGYIVRDMYPDWTVFPVAMKTMYYLWRSHAHIIQQQFSDSGKLYTTANEATEDMRQLKYHSSGSVDPFTVFLQSLRDTVELHTSSSSSSTSGSSRQQSNTVDDKQLDATINHIHVISNDSIQHHNNSTLWSNELMESFIGVSHSLVVC